MFALFIFSIAYHIIQQNNIKKYIFHHNSTDIQFTLLAETLSDDSYSSLSLSLGRIQCLLQYKLCQELEIDSYPTLILYSAREPVIYNKAHRESAMIEWLLERIQSEVHIISNLETLNAFIDKYALSLIAYDIIPNQMKIFKDVHHMHNYEQRVEFAVYDIFSAEKNTNPESNSALVFYRNHQQWLSMNASVSNFYHKTILNFIALNLLPNIEQITPQNLSNVLRSQFGLFWLWIDINHKSMNERIFKVVEDLMSFHRISKFEPFGCVFSDAFQFPLHLQSLDFDPISFSAKPYANKDILPQALFMYQGRKYHCPSHLMSDFTFDGFQTFVSAITRVGIRAEKDSRIQFGTRSLTSEYGHPLLAPVDVVNDAVHMINSEYHDRIAFNSSVAVLVQYYARWSERCMHFANDYRAVGKEFYVDTNVLVTKMNIVHNDPPMQLKSLPTLVLYFKGRSQKFIQYDGILHANAIIQWVNEHKNTIEHQSLKERFKIQFI